MFLATEPSSQLCHGVPNMFLTRLFPNCLNDYIILTLPANPSNYFHMFLPCSFSVLIDEDYDFVSRPLRPK